LSRKIGLVAFELELSTDLRSSLLGITNQEQMQIGIRSLDELRTMREKRTPKSLRA
jgi:hypothetical protein